MTAIIKEFTGLAQKGVFSIALVPQARSSIPLKLVLKIKYNADGSYDKHKARAVVLG